MPPLARDVDQPDLFGPKGRIPTVAAVTLTRQSGITSLRKGWLPRHTVAMVVLSPLVFGGYTAALGAGLHDPLGAALILTTYLPLRGAVPAAGSSCAVMAGLLVPGAGILLSQGSGIFGGVIALGILSLGLAQRVSGTSACG